MLPGDNDSTAMFTPNRKFNNKDEAQAAAESQAEALQRSLGEADLTLAKGDPWIRDNVRMLITGMRDGINGSYITSIVSHTYVKDQGIATHIKAKPPEDGGDYESLFNEATPEQRKQLFLDPTPGGLMGQAFGNRLSAGDLANGLSPFQTF